MQLGTALLVRETLERKAPHNANLTHLQNLPEYAPNRVHKTAQTYLNTIVNPHQTYLNTLVNPGKSQFSDLSKPS